VDANGHPGTAERERRLPDVNEHSCWHLEVHAARVICLSRGRQVKIGELDLVGTIVRQVKQRVPDDSVILQLCLMAIPENKQSAGLGYNRLRRSWLRGWLWRGFGFNGSHAGPPGTGIRAATIKNGWTAFVLVLIVVVGIFFRLDDHYLRVGNAVTYPCKREETAAGTVTADEHWRLATALKEWIEAAATEASMASETVRPKRSYAGRDTGRE
jgi:hypothetical protein